MPSEILIGIDLGTTVLKAGAIDRRSGRVLAVAAQRLAVRAAADGTREQKLADLNRGFDIVLAQLRTQLGRQWLRVAGLGLASQGGSFAICNRQTGAALTPLRLWSDQRPGRLVPQVAALRPVSYWRKLAFSNGPGWGLARLLWLREQNPRLFAAENIYVGAGEFAIFQLTGQWRQDAGNAVQIGCYRVPKRALDAEPLGLVDVPLSFVAPLREGLLTVSPAAARRWQLPVGIPVAGPYFDHEAGYLSAVGVSARPLQCSLGTAWVGNFNLPANVTVKSSNQLVVPAPHNPGWLVVQPLLTGNVTWDWALDTFIGGPQPAALRQAGKIFAKQLLPPPGMVALPWMHLMNPLQRDAIGAGGFFGGGVAASRADFVRAVVLGMTCEMARVFQKVRDHGQADSLVLGGGASKGPMFRSYLAALFAPLPVLALQEEDTAGLRGCLHELSPHAAAGQARLVKVPAEAGRIQAGFAVYCELFERVLGREGILPLDF